MSEERSFARELAKTRYSADRAYGLIVFGLALVGVAVFGLFRDGPSAFGQGAAAVGGLLVLMGGGLLGIRWHRLQAAYAVVNKGAQAEGTVRAIRRQWLSRDYALDFEFRDPFGRAVQGKQVMSQEEAFTWRQGDKGFVRVDPKQSRNHVWIGRGVLFDEEDEQNELGTIGTITAVTDKLGDDQRAWLVRYRYRDHVGQDHEAVFDGREVEEEASWRVGDKGEVRFDPQCPDAGRWVRKVDDAAIAPDIAPVAVPGAGAPRPPGLPVAAGEPSFVRLAWRSRGVRKAVLYLVPGVLVVGIVLFMAAIVASGRATLEEDPSVLWVIPAIAGALFVVPALWSLRRGVREVREWQRVLRGGMATTAVVSLVKETYEEVRGRRGIRMRKRGWIVFYRYQDAQGKTHSGESGYLSRREAAVCRVGDPCVIRYDAKQPESSVWMGRE